MIVFTERAHEMELYSLKHRLKVHRLHENTKGIIVHALYHQVASIRTQSVHRRDFFFGGLFFSHLLNSSFDFSTFALI